MEFRTKISPLKSAGLIDHSTPIVLLGSCFTDHIGRRLQSELFDAIVNPFGTLYNPASILGALRRIADCRAFTPDDLFRHGNLWHSFDCHSSLSSPDAEAMLSQLNDIVTNAHQRLKETLVLFITLGTSWVFRHKSSGQIVANCHKLSADTFDRQSLDSSEIASTLREIVGVVREQNADCTIVFTISPIRHKADGLHGNNLSKSRLLLAVDEVIAQTTGTIYFPAYEALLDDLRDYRFYADDMCHPSAAAVQYIYELFADSFFTEATKKTAAECGKYSALCNHRPLSRAEADIDAHRHAIERARHNLTTNHPEIKIR